MSSSETTANRRGRRGRIFDLTERTPQGDPFESTEECRAYDRSVRTSMIIPMQHMMKLVGPDCGPDKEVLEIGCASGLLSLRLAALHPGSTFTGLDANDAFLEVARENTIFANLVSYGGDFACDWARYTRLPFADDSFDVVFSFCAINRWDKPARIIPELARVCRPGGTVLLYDLARDADEGMVSFVLQYAGGDANAFMRSLRASYSADEMRELLDAAGLAHWSVAKEGINLIISSRDQETGYSVGEPGIYERIFD
ncbi:class I SAM-dependent methyltransferase [Kitasatospora brasiliensis]|uniref:class I SAM-dependent methyltransferase n=1 Tax=Kitasatospora brasiliensis TaxID=3058040 RepID=UPI00292CF52C|nr:class I SAM-dependent methyltransferase [Kitasatospora sp. K002]